MFVNYNIWDEVFFFNPYDKYEITKWIVQEIRINSDWIFINMKVDSPNVSESTLREQQIFPSNKKAKEFMKNKLLEQLEDL